MKAFLVLLTIVNVAVADERLDRKVADTLETVTVDDLYTKAGLLKEGTVLKVRFRSRVEEITFAEDASATCWMSYGRSILVKVPRDGVPFLKHIPASRDSSIPHWTAIARVIKEPPRKGGPQGFMLELLGVRVASDLKGPVATWK